MPIEYENRQQKVYSEVLQETRPLQVYYAQPYHLQVE